MVDHQLQATFTAPLVDVEAIDEVNLIGQHRFARGVEPIWSALQRIESNRIEAPSGIAKLDPHLEVVLAHDPYVAQPKRLIERRLGESLTPGTGLT